MISKNSLNLSSSAQQLSVSAEQTSSTANDSQAAMAEMSNGVQMNMIKETSGTIG